MTPDQLTVAVVVLGAWCLGLTVEGWRWVGALKREFPRIWRQLDGGPKDGGGS